MAYKRKKNGNKEKTTTTTMTQNNRAVSFEPLAQPENLTLQGVQIVYEPSVFGGDGTETRKNIVFTVPPSFAAHLQSLESGIDSNRLCSCLKGDALRCKLDLHKIDIYDADRNRVPPPEVWRGLTVNAMIKVKGKWSTRLQTGFCIEVQAIQLLDVAAPDCPFPTAYANAIAVT